MRERLIDPEITQPLISVVIPAYNAAGTIGEQLQALANQTYRGPWEVVVGDNGSTDATCTVAESFIDRLPAIRVIDASARRGAAAARNIGARAARGDYLAFCDADDVVSREWLTAFVTALSEHDFIAGAMDHDSLNPKYTAGWHFRSHETSPPLAQRFLPFALSGNTAITRVAFEDAGGFPEDLGSAGEDVAFSWQMQLVGHELHFEPRAIVAYRQRHDAKSLWRQQVSFGIAEVVLYKRFRERGVPRSRILGAGRAYLRLLVRISWLASPTWRGRWLRGFAKRWGRLRGSVRERVLYL